MNDLKIEGNWNKIKGKLKQEYGMLTDADLSLEEGKVEEVLGRLQVKLGKSKEEIKSYIKSI